MRTSSSLPVSQVLLHGVVFPAGEGMEHAAVPAFHVQHHPVADLHQLRVSAQIDGAVAVHQAGEPRPVGQLEKRHQEFRYRAHSPPETVMPRMKGMLSRTLANTCSGVISVTLGEA